TTRRLGVNQDRDARDVRRNLPKQSDPLAAHRKLKIREAGDVAARPRQAHHEAAADRIGHAYEYSRYGTSCLQGRQRGRAADEDHIWCQANQLGRIRPDAASVSGGPAIVDSDVLPVSPTETLERGQECCDAGLHFRIICGNHHQDANAPQPLAVLRPRGERPRRNRASNHLDEVAPSHAARSGAHDQANPIQSAAVAPCCWTAKTCAALEGASTQNPLSKLLCDARLLTEFWLDTRSGSRRSRLILLLDDQELQRCVANVSQFMPGNRRNVSVATSTKLDLPRTLFVLQLCVLEQFFARFLALPLDR